MRFCRTTVTFHGGGSSSQGGQDQLKLKNSTGSTSLVPAMEKIWLRTAQ